jgi:hypothetical protein
MGERSGMSPEEIIARLRLKAAHEEHDSHEWKPIASLPGWRGCACGYVSLPREDLPVLIRRLDELGCEPREVTR